MKTILLVTSSLILTTAAVFQFVLARPVYVDVSELDDACGAVAIITKEQSALLNRPSRFSRSLGELEVGSTVSLCSEVKEWYGIVVRHNGVDCLHGASGGGKYLGPCSFGWVRNSDVEFLAG